MRAQHLLCLFAASLGCLALAGCDRVGEKVEITKSREISKHATRPPANASSSVRFPQPEPPTPPVEQAPPPPPADELFVWEMPEGWTIEPPKPGTMRMLDMRFGPEKEGQCYMSIIPGGGGGLVANVNRWRGQMSQPPLPDSAILELPKKNLFNGTATFVDLEGDFTDVGQPTQKDFRMLGLIHADERFMIFVKLTGPKALVAREASAFEQFCQSLQLKAPR